MSEAKHTPGPWMMPHFADDSATCNCTSVLSDSQHGMGCIATVPHGDENEPLEIAKANARLIAAAPDLLEALKDLLTITIDLRAKVAAAGVATSFAELEAITYAETAIAKAEGGAA